MGLGIQGGGMGVARYFAKHGTNVLVTDLKTETELESSIAQLQTFPNIQFRLGGHEDEDFLSADCIVKGPSIRWDNPYIEKALQKNIPVIMESAYFAKHTKATLVGITGTRGKTTTTHMIHSVLQKFYTKGKIYLSGNIPGSCAIELLDKANADDIVILELSSWQLSGFHREEVSPKYAVFTNVYEDHLNHYKDMGDYVHDKTAIFRYQKPQDSLITTAKALENFRKNTITIPSAIVECTTDDYPSELLHMRGDHNKLNAALAQKTAQLILPETDPHKITQEIRETHAVNFRQQIVTQSGNIVVVNDTTSTTPTSAIIAIETFTDKKIVLVLGGNSKNLSLQGLAETIIKNVERIHAIILLEGSMTDEIVPILSSIEKLQVSSVHKNFTQAVQDAYRVALEADEPIYLLFSPGATSFAQFRNEFDRGEKFNAIISDIIKK